MLGRHSGYLERSALYTVRKKDFTDSEITAEVIERLQEAARERSRYGHCLRWDQIDLGSGRLHVHRAKGGVDTVHPLSGREIRALRQLRRENTESRYVFLTERGGPATTAGFLKTIARTGEAAKLPFPVHPHMLRTFNGLQARQ